MACSSYGESQQRSELLLKAKNDTFRSLFDRLRRELEPEINSFNSKLFSEGVISPDIMSANSIETTLSAIRGRLENEESTFENVINVLSDIPSKEHLARKLKDTLQQKMEETGCDEMVTKPHSYLSASHTSTSLVAGKRVFVPSVPSAKRTIGSSPTVAPSSPLSQGTWSTNPAGTQGKDSALTSSHSTNDENEEEKNIGHPTNEDMADNPQIPLPASGTIPDSAPLQRRTSIVLKNEMLEKEVARLEQRVEQLEREKRDCQQMLPQAIEIRLQLLTVTSNIKQREEVIKAKEEEVKSLRRQLIQVKQDQENMEIALNQELEKLEERAQMLEQRAEDAEEKAQKSEQRAEDAEEKARKYKQDYEVARKNITKLVSALRCRNGRLDAVDEELDSLESQASASEFEDDSKQSSSDQDS